MSTFAQTKNVKGTISDVDGEPLIGVNVLEENTNNGTITDFDGKYSLEVSSTQSHLVFSYIGYETQRVAVDNRSVIDIILLEDTKSLEEVIVIGYGTQTRKEITGSISNVTEKDFNKGATQNAADLLQGRVAGLSITSTSGDLNDDSIIRLRGVNTLQKDNGPFIVIDGVPGGDISSVAPQDIESISVLKDASSAAIYGSRSAGGVSTLSL